MARIIIDAGHGGSARAGNSSAYGSRGPSGLLEKDVTLDIARHVVARLGSDAALTRTGDANLPLGARAAHATRDGADVFVSIHANSGAPEMVGPETWVHPEAGAGSHRLAGGIQHALERLAGRYGGSAESRRGPMAVLSPAVVGRRTAACLVEVDYLSNPHGERRLRDPGERAAIGAAIAGAIREHLGERRYGQGPQASVQRLRSSIWVGDPGDVLGGWADIQTGRLKRDSSLVSSRTGVVDDLTLLTTIHMSKDRGVTWRNDNVVKLFPEALQLCHDSKVQLFAGYTMANELSSTSARGKLFVEWIRNPVAPTPAEHAAAIVKFLWEDHKLDFDGIGFDIELNGLRPSDKSGFIDFYGHLADLLKQRGKVLSIATGIGYIGTEAQTLGTFAAQPFEIAKGHDNVIMRPMCYDVFELSDDAIERWRAHVIDYALDTVGLAPSQFQLGLKTSSNQDIWSAKGLTHPRGWSSRKCCLDAAGVADFCKRYLRPRSVGVITFAGFTDSRTIDDGLNPGAPRAGTSGQPLQQPIP